MFGLGFQEFIILFLLACAILYFILRSKGRTKAPAVNSLQRKCLICQYTGPMKTWLGNYNLPQFIALVLLFAYLIPGLIFIGWGWGKYKCPQCGALAKNIPFVPENK